MLALRSTPRAEASHVRGSLRDVADAAQSIDTRPFEIADAHTLAHLLVPRLQRVLDEAIARLSEVLDRHEIPAPEVSPRGSQDSGVFDLVLDEFVEEAAPASPDRHIADLAFMARWELVRKRSGIAESLAAGDERRLVGECCSARRRIIKALSGVERVLAEVEQLPTLFANIYMTERQRAVETRAAYHVFRVGVHAASTQWAHRDLVRCMRLIGAGIARLIGRPIYEDLRIDDRRSIRAMQARLVRWVREPEPLEGRRLVSEIESAAALLMDVNRRPVLIEHDCEVLDKLLAALRQPATDKAKFYVLLTTLRGRDAELDSLIELQRDLVADTWEPPALALRAKLREQSANCRPIEHDDSGVLHAW